METNNLTTALQSYFDRVRNKIQDAVSETAAAMAESAAKKAPHHLKGHITPVIGHKGFPAKVSAVSPQAAIAEYGAVHNPVEDMHRNTVHHLHAEGRARHGSNSAAGKPYLNPSFEEQMPRLLDKLQAILSE
ncbi:MAG: hypothetical protein HKL88_10575 [Bacteroidia bacterium]|nr:hypothetical protein [Bacteroidia bacterium]